MDRPVVYQSLHPLNPINSINGKWLVYFSVTLREMHVCMYVLMHKWNNPSRLVPRAHHVTYQMSQKDVDISFAFNWMIYECATMDAPSQLCI